MTEITLPQILDEREERVAIQKDLLKKYSCPLISFTMNIAGPIKISPIITRAFNWGLAALERDLGAYEILSRRVDYLVTGCRAIIAVKTDPQTIKDLCLAIEDSTPLGRLFDMDVINTDGSKLERQSLRGCIVCGAPGRACAAGRLHSVAELQAATAKIISEHFALSDRELAATLAQNALIKEVNTTPKPGLVDRRNCGSHSDMTLSTFEKSAKALKNYFAECFSIGQATATLHPAESFPPLRQAGIRAEKDMYAATEGVNTHKGAIYSMGLLCGALGRLWSPEVPFADTANILDEAAKIVATAAENDLRSAKGDTAGQRLYLERGIRGIRGEAASGFPSISTIALPKYKELLVGGVDQNTAGVITLLHLIATLEDTTLYHRGGEVGAKYAAEYAKRLLNLTPAPTLADVEKADDDFIARNLSPGGSADLLALTYFLYDIEKAVSNA